MWLAQRRFLSLQPEASPAISNIKWKLQSYLDTGKFQKLSVRELRRKNDQARIKSKRFYKSEGISPQKTLILLKSRYDGVIISDGLGSAIDLQAISPNNLRINDPKLLQIFNGLMQVRKVQRRKIDDRILMALTGVTRELLQDSHFVAHDVAYLLEKDNDIVRAMEVCRLARGNGSVGINAVLDWCLKRSKKQLADKVLVNRGKWGIPPTPATYVTYFSGISDCHEWGQVSDDLAQEVIRRFSENPICHNIETFNAALKLLMKNYTNDQTFSWNFLENLHEIKIRPDAQTFTIFLQGLRAHYQTNIRLIQKDPSLSRGTRIQKLFEKQAILILQANLIMEKAMFFGTPPTPPDFDKEANPAKSVSEYKRELQVPCLDIDRYFAVAFLLCYCESSAGTSWANNSGSHYWYLQQSLAYLQAWMPEIDDIVTFVASTSRQGSVEKTGGIIHLEPKPEIVKKTDTRTKVANIADEHSPQNVATLKTLEDMNPFVLFPPSPFTHAHDPAFLTGIKRQLIDFGRIKSGDLHKEFLRYKESRQQAPKGKRIAIKKRSSLRKDKQGINKFLLRIFLDSILRLGLYEEFYRAMWLSILKWADIKVDQERLRAATPLQLRVVTTEMYPVIHSLVNKKSDVGFCTLDAQLDVIDIGLVEDFMHKIDQHMPRACNPTALVVELVATFSNREINREKELSPRPSTFDAVFAMLNRDIHRYGDRNVTMGHQDSEKKSLPNKTQKNSITFSQLAEVLDSLDILVRSIFSRFGGKSMNFDFLESYNNLIQKIYSSTWTDILESGVKAMVIHKKIVRSGILMYRPDHLVDKRENHTYSRLIKRSMTFIHDQLKSENNLSREDVDLMMCLRNLSGLERKKENAESEYEVLQMKIYRLTGELSANLKINR